MKKSAGNDRSARQSIETMISVEYRVIFTTERGNRYV